MSIEFFQTPMGRMFFEATMPGLVGALKAIAEHLSRGNVVQAEEEKRRLEQKFWEKAFLASLHCVPHNALDHVGWAGRCADEALKVWREHLISTTPMRE